MPSKTFSDLFGLVAAAASVVQITHGASFVSSPSMNSAISQVSSASSLYTSSAASQTMPSVSPPTVSSTSPTATYEFGCDTHNASPLFRAYSAANGDHYYTTDFSEMMNALDVHGYEYQGPAGHVLSSKRERTSLLYSAYSHSAMDHFYTISQDDMDSAIKDGTYVSDGTAAYVYATSICGSIPFYRLYNPELQDNLYTTNTTERDDAMDNGYTFVEIACYILPDFYVD